LLQKKVKILAFPLAKGGRAGGFSKKRKISLVRPFFFLNFIFQIPKIKKNRRVFVRHGGFYG